MTFQNFMYFCAAVWLTIPICYPIKMAKIHSSLAGNIRGRVGSTVFRKGQRAVIAAQYQPSVANPRALGQQIQRAAFATASGGAAGLAFIVNHSHEGISGKRENLQKFIKQNAAIFRAAIQQAVQDPEHVAYNGNINLRGVTGIQPAPYLVSTGSVSFMQPTANDVNSAGRVRITTETVPTTVANAAEYEVFLAKMGLIPGDQLSVVFICTAANRPTSGMYQGSTGTYADYACHVLASRVTFKTTSEVDFTSSVTTIADGKFTDAIIKRADGDMTVTVVSSGELAGFYVGDGRIGDDIAEAGGVVRSQLDGNGKFIYSTSRLVCTGEYDYLLDGLESYSNVTTMPDGSSRFLDNPEYAPFGVGE
jgi:hypothetical protein